MSDASHSAYELYTQGRELMDDGKAEEAATILERSAEINPHFKTLEVLGECYVAMGRLRDAVVPLAAATSLNEQSRAPALLADVLYQLGEAETATRVARLALSRGPGNRLALSVLARLGGKGESDG